MLQSLLMILLISNLYSQCDDSNRRVRNDRVTIDRVVGRIRDDSRKYSN